METLYEAYTSVVEGEDAGQLLSGALSTSDAPAAGLIPSILQNATPAKAIPNLVALNHLVERESIEALIHPIRTVVRSITPTYAAQAHQYVVRLGQKLAVALESASRPEVGADIFAVMLRSAPDKSTLTPLHVHFVTFALQAKAYHLAEEILQYEVYDVDHAKSYRLTATDVLLYHYYAGMLYAGLHQWNAALLKWKMCLIVPGLVPSAIMVEAHRKACVASLLAHGKPFVMPAAVNASMDSMISHVNRLYVDLAGSFEKDLKSPGPLTQYITDNAGEFAAHENTAIVSLLLKDAAFRRIARLTATYVAVSLADVATAAGVTSTAEAEEMVAEMILTGRLAASIDQVRGVVRFDAQDKHSHQDEAAITAALTAATDRVSNLIARLKAAEASAMLTKGFHSKKGSTAASDALMHGGSYWEGTADLPHEPSVGDIIDED